mmetsp:Transcript_9068/g.14879  ORF Transcript_9068/g.14879 Transcript_9068/m.14879 type:complete len:108 (+) Transcript_9068:198-521(+)
MVVMRRMSSPSRYQLPTSYLPATELLSQQQQQKSISSSININIKRTTKLICSRHYLPSSPLPYLLGVVAIIYEMSRLPRSTYKIKGYHSLKIENFETQRIPNSGVNF